MNGQRILEKFNPVRDFIFVTSCFHCGRRLERDEKRICRQCWDSLIEVDEHDHTYSVLKERFADGGVIDDSISLYYFEKGNLLQSLAHALKYQEIVQIGFELGEKLGRRLVQKKIQCDTIVPVPLNKQKQRERGYNQSEFIAKGIASIMPGAKVSNVVHRVKNTVTQTHLNAQERQDNVSGAFVLSDSANIARRTVLIVDDIITTGSTIQEVAKTLKMGEAKKIIAVSVGLAKLGSGV